MKPMFDVWCAVVGMVIQCHVSPVCSFFFFESCANCLCPLLLFQATPLFPELLQRALDLVEQCSCPYTKGCPGCVQHLDCKNYNAVLNKAGAVLVLKAALEMMQQATVEQQQGNVLAMEDS